MSETEDDLNVLIDFDQEFKIIRVIEGTFVPSNVKMSAEVIPTGDDISSADFEIAISKCRFWLENIVPRCLAFCRSNETAVSMIIDENGKNRCSNFLMLTPYEPTDDHLAGLFQSKLTALSDGAIVFGSVKFKTDNITGLTFHFVGDAGDYLPSMAEWIPGPTYFDRAWWDRDDASTLDVSPPDGADLTVKPTWAYKIDFFDQAIRGTQEEVIVRPDFTPKVIKGDIDD